MDDSSSSEPWTRHRWDFGDGQFSNQPTPSHTYRQAGVYTVSHSVWSDTACIDSAFNRYVQRINVLPAPRAGLWVDTQRVNIYAPRFVLRDSSSSDAVQRGTIMGDGTEYLGELYWAHTYADTGTYTVSHWVLAANGCSDTVIRTLRVDAEFRVFIPNAFRPNGDGRNEVFRPYGADWRKMELTIIDRWGGVVYRTTDALAGWNGRRMNQGQLMPEGIYAYRILVFGKKGHFAERMGTVMLVH
jgi:gliding motility-associated-like protein